MLVGLVMFFNSMNLDTKLVVVGSKSRFFGMTFFWIADFSPQVQSTKKWDDLFHYVEQVSLVHKGTSLPTDHCE